MELYLKHNLPDIELSGCNDSVDVSVAIGGVSLMSFPLQSYAGNLRLNTRELLRSVELMPLSADDVVAAESPVSVPVKVVTLSLSGHGDFDFAIVDGGSAQSLGDFFQTHWLTWRPQKSRTPIGGIEILAFVVENPVAVECVARVRVTAYDKFSGVLSKSIEINLQESGLPAMVVVPVSYRVIKSLFEMEDDNILAYDVSAEYAGHKLPTRRYIVADDKLGQRCFLFKNTLGFYDTVYASGLIKSKLESDLQTFKCNDVERELDNNAVESFTVNSGYVQTSREYDHWLDFLSSDERYEVGYGQLHKIVMEEIKAEREFHKLSSVQFTYHLAEKPKGRYYENEPIELFDYDISEF